jgi:hypothetical protein
LWIVSARHFGAALNSGRTPQNDRTFNEPILAFSQMGIVKTHWQLGSRSVGLITHLTLLADVYFSASPAACSTSQT